MKKNKLHSAIFLFLIATQMLGCTQKTTSGESGSSINLGGGSESGGDDPDGTNPTVNIDAPTNIVLSNQNGTPNVTITQLTVRRYFHIHWSNTESTASTIVQVKKSTDASYPAGTTVAGTSNDLDYDVGYVSSDVGYNVRIKNVKGSDSSAYTSVTSITVPASKIPPPLNFGAGDAGNFHDLYFSWAYPNYVAGEVTGYEIKTTVHSGGSAVPNITPVASASSNYYYYDPCGGSTSGIDAVDGSIRAVGGVNTVSSDFTADNGIGCPFYN